MLVLRHERDSGNWDREFFTGVDVPMACTNSRWVPHTLTAREHELACLLDAAGAYITGVGTKYTTFGGAYTFYHLLHNALTSK